MNPVTPDAFDAYYYRHCCGKPYVRNEEWLGLFGHIADRIVSDMAPQRVLDAGCAMGFLVEALRGRGVEAWGIDISPFAIAQVHESIRPYCREGSITDDLGGTYDLIVSIEVAEHMSPRDAETAIRRLCGSTGDVLFSSSPLDYREPTHVNVHQPEYWAEAFARHGFFRDVDYDASYVLPWAARFRASQEPSHRLVRNYERRYWELLKEATDARAYSTDTQRLLAASESECDTLRQERDRLLAEREAGERDLSEAREAADACRRNLELVRDELSRARHTIASMEQSRFWRLRLAYLRLRNALVRSDE